jgi:hypothetical protein
MLPSLQFGGAPPVQTPFWQLSAVVHALLSLQTVPFGTGAYRQPVAGLQLSTVQTLWSSHERGEETHVPFTHASFVHAFPSVQLFVLSFV